MQFAVDSVLRLLVGSVLAKGWRYATNAIHSMEADNSLLRSRPPISETS